VIKKILIILLTSFISSSLYANFLPEAFTILFEQEYKATLSGKTRKSEGVLNYKFPSQIRFEIKKPDQVVFVSNPTNSWYYTAPFIEGEPGELKLNPTKNNVLSQFFDTLRQGLVENKHYKVKADSDVVRTLTFTKEISEELGIIEAKLYFKTSKLDFDNLEKLSIKQVDDKEFSLSLKSFVKNPKFTKDDFVFKAPENTRVSQ
jgi:outer membrane lipoprotein-sorting protein